MKMIQKYLALLTFILMACYILEMIQRINLIVLTTNTHSEYIIRKFGDRDRSCMVESWTTIDPTASALKRSIFCDDFSEQSDILCRWYLDQNNITDHKQCLLPQDGYRVPNIVFYITFGRYNFTMLHYMCILSARKIQHPEAIYVIGDQEPLGEWWNRLVSDVPNLKFIYREEPKKIHGVHVNWSAHASDVVRLQILLANGGIYMDTDEIFVKNVDPIRHHNLTMGIIDKFTGMGNAVILAQRNSPFLQKIYDNYRTYNSTNYYSNSLKFAYSLWERDRKALHLESMKFYSPLWSQTDVLYNSTGFKWRKSYAMHIWTWNTNYSLPQNIHDIDDLNTTLGEVFRHVYYGDSRLRGKLTLK